MDNTRIGEEIALCQFLLAEVIKNVGYIPGFYVGLYIASQVAACGGLVSGARTQR